MKSQLKKMKKKQITMTRAKIEKIKKEAMGDAVDRSILLLVTAMKDEGLSDSKLNKVIERANRYAEHIDDNLVRIKETQKMLADTYGITVKGF